MASQIASIVDRGVKDPHTKGNHRLKFPNQVAKDWIVSNFLTCKIHIKFCANFFLVIFKYTILQC